MRILAISNLYPPAMLGGYERECMQIARALRERGHAVTVLTGAPRFPYTEAEDTDEDVIRSLRVTSELLGMAWRRRPNRERDMLYEAIGNFVDAGNAGAVSAAIDRHTPDVVLMHNLHAIGTLGILATVSYRGVPWVSSINDAVMAYACSLGDAPVRALAEAFSAAIEGTWIVVSSHVREETERLGPQLRGRVEMIPGWVEKPVSPTRPQSYRPGDHLRLAYAGVVVEFKGVGILIDALGLLAREGITDVSLDLAGPVLDPDLPRRAVREGVERQVRFRGPQSNAACLEMMSTCPVFAFPTHAREPFGRVPIEAAAQGSVPLISDDCGVAEWLVDGVHCLKAPPTAEAFAAALGRIFRGEVDLAPIARRAHAAVLRDFAIDAIAPRVERILSETAATGTGIRGDTATLVRAALVAERTIVDMIEEHNDRLVGLAAAEARG